MSDITYRQIYVQPAQKYVLRAKWVDGGVNILLVSRESAWSGELLPEETKKISREFGLEVSQYVEEIRSAIGTKKLNHCGPSNFIYMLQDNVFTWKKYVANGMLAKLGSVYVQKVLVAETYEDILDHLIEKLSTCEENLQVLENENTLLKKDRDKAMAMVRELASVKDEWEKTLYGRFIALLNTKKQKIQSLEEELELQVSHASEEQFETTRQEPKDEDYNVESDSNTDPYKAPTDIDSDLEEDAEHQRSLSPQPTSSASATLRRHHDIFESFDSSPSSPMSPAPSLPKRARIPAEAAMQVVQATAIPQGTQDLTHEMDQNSAPLDSTREEDCQDGEDDMEPLTLRQNTEDLLEEF